MTAFEVKRTIRKEHIVYLNDSQHSIDDDRCLVIQEAVALSSDNDTLYQSLRGTIYFGLLGLDITKDD
ncbi:MULTISPECIES: hypothetical protein [unclassified Photobacterium]|uniref:hypothetical protein n=1 Tax=unclassified Photobacterium TaxID=2628852 RepID=UPI000D170AA4|nr:MULTISPECIES: hypothetical protein [unclassified Photobacterium]PSV25456.1 hypothetical protein C9J42_15780 [Photobacterium sp. GB-56]PSV30039.1 hypothetical protein C9J40_13840 [Photobacterium sp. GB-72]PSV33992.1 hypothetical protein C9J44_16640 [Photobacterium sp. GB-27]PSV38023.1 hypothetical protein C9J38_09295 [Photobacterium sp. GB-210]PSV41797.1 hypothetical protein C9J46_16325 [Photobacterium sp. GB-36]